CLPHPTFFRYCAELLEKYRNDERIMAIRGSNFSDRNENIRVSYHFSRYPIAWGWASWRRAWQYYDSDMRHWPTLRDLSCLIDLLDDKNSARYWREIFDDYYAKTLEGGYGAEWDYLWMLTCWAHHGLTIAPNVNLISNIGFGAGATHTHEYVRDMANI